MRFSGLEKKTNISVAAVTEAAPKPFADQPRPKPPATASNDAAEPAATDGVVKEESAAPKYSWKVYAREGGEALYIENPVIDGYDYTGLFSEYVARVEAQCEDREEELAAPELEYEGGPYVCTVRVLDSRGWRTAFELSELTDEKEGSS